jgi:hypothetical protein
LSQFTTSKVSFPFETIAGLWCWNISQRLCIISNELKVKNEELKMKN